MMTTNDINLVLDRIAKQGPIVASYDNGLTRLDEDARMDVVHSSKTEPTGLDARMHYVSLKTLIKCLRELPQSKPAA